MKKRYRFLLLLVPVLLLAITLSGCGNQSAFIKAKQANAASYAREKLVVSVNATNGDYISGHVRSIKGTIYTDNKNKLVRATGSVNGAKYYDGTMFIDSSSKRLYLSAKTLFNSTSEDWQAYGIEPNDYANTYISYSGSELGENLKDYNLQSGLTNTKLQAAMAKELGSVLQGTDSKKFVKKGTKISYTYTSKQFKQLIKDSNAQLKNNHQTKSQAFSKAELKRLLADFDGAKVTETLDTKDRSIDNFSVRQDGKTIVMKTKMTKAASAVSLPTDSMTLSEFQQDLEKKATAAYAQYYAQYYGSSDDGSDSSDSGGDSGSNSSGNSDGGSTDQNSNSTDSYEAV